jgi:hypothetical protein
VSLQFRNDDTNPPTSDQFKTYAGGAGAGAWQSLVMTQRIVAPVTGVTPQFIADYYVTKVTGVSNAFMDYYVAATDARGNTFKSPIQHVWVGKNLGGVSGGGSTNTNSTVTTNLPAFTLDGALDSTNFLLASSGMTIHAALRGSLLYVATWSPGNSGGANDHFIFVTDQLLASATAAAPWAKTGLVAVATSKPFLAGESVGSYVSWFANGSATNWPCAKAAVNSGALEGTIDLVAAFGAMPTNIYLCSAAYATADGGALASSCPTNSGANLTNFFCIPLAALRDHNGDGTFDRLQPTADFAVQNFSRSNSTLTLNCAAFPGRQYQLSYRDNLTNGAWLDLPGATNICGALQTNVVLTAPVPNGQRFFRARLLP